MRALTTRSRWAAIGAAVAVTLGAGGVSLTQAAIGTGPKPVYVALAEPCRLVDTRPNNAIGPKSTPIAAGDAAAYEIQVTGANGNCTGPLAIPVDALAVALNVTAIAPTARSFFTVYPSGVARPTTSNLNFVAGQAPTPNKVDVGLSSSGRITIFNESGTAHAAVDVFGYYTDHHHDDRYYTEPEIDTLLDGVGSTPGPAGPAGPIGPAGPAGPEGPAGDALYEQITVVNGNQSAVANGSALLTAVAASTGATDAAPEAIYLEPGTYDIGGTRLVLPDDVSLLGSGRGTTTITGSNLYVVEAGDRSTIADLHVDSTATENNSIVVRLAADTDVSIRSILVTASDAGANGIEAINGSDRLRVSGAIVEVPDVGVLIAGSVDAVIEHSDLISSLNSAVGLSFSTTATVRVVSSRLENGGSRGLIRMVNSLGTLTIDVLHSTLVSPNGSSFEPSPGDLADATADTFRIYQSHVDVADPFPALGNTTATCVMISTPTASSPTTCV